MSNPVIVRKPATVNVPATAETPEQEIARLRAENDALRTANAKRMLSQVLTIKVSEKGAISIYGLGKWPVTLYWEQWVKVLNKSADIVAFIEANRSKLKSKADE